MSNYYDKQYKEQALKLAEDIGIRNASEKLGISYHTLYDWRRKQRKHGADSFIGSGHAYKKESDASKSSREIALERENEELRRANDILKDALGFFAQDRKK